MRACLRVPSVRVLPRGEAIVPDLQEEEVDRVQTDTQVLVAILVRGVVVDGDPVSRISAQGAVLFRDLRLGAVFELLVLLVVCITVGLVRGVVYVIIVVRQYTLGKSVHIFFMVARVLLSMILDLLGSVFTLSILVAFGDRVHKLIRGVHLLVELSLFQLLREVVDVVNHRVRAEFLL